MILQGTVDDLFTLDEGIANYGALSRQGTTVSMAWFCGGHGVCLTDPGISHRSGSSLAGLDAAIRGRGHLGTRAQGLRLRRSERNLVRGLQLSAAPGAPIVASGSGSLALKAGGGSGPPTVAANAQAANAVDVVAYPVTPGPAANALNITVPITRAAVVVGAPRLSMTYSGTVAPGTRPTRVFAQLVDPATGIVVNNQITPIPVTLDGRPHALTIPLETVSYTARAGTSLELQLVATTVAYITPRLGGTVKFSRITVVLPTVNGLSVLQRG